VEKVSSGKGVRYLFVPFRRRAQQQLTVRLDADVVAWLQRQGEDYQSRLNGLLRKAMQDEIRR